MQKAAVFMLILAIITGCKNSPGLSDQLRENLSSRLHKIDSTVVIDSFKIIKIDTLTVRLDKILEDSDDTRLLRSVQQQLEDALTRHNKDSIDYFRNEVSYISSQIDTITKSIKSADTTRKNGIRTTCYYQIGKSGKTTGGTIFYFIDKSGRITNTEMLDSMVTRACRRLK